ncbi:MAG: hypothetical protein L3J79_01125 [Candidatus Marinimicrobia bacterium]|nr:hypothetical protein [Candidatus Neomarinimicrobiota bacterium]
MHSHIIILKIIHIFAGVFWVGFAFFNIAFLQPAVKATGVEGQKLMQFLVRNTRLMMTVYITATLTILSGLGLYWPLAGSTSSFVRTGYGLILTISSTAGIIAWIIAVFVIRNIFNQMGALGTEIQSQEGPPSEGQMSGLQRLGAKLGVVGNIVIFFMVIALLGMSTARYSHF